MFTGDSQNYPGASVLSNSIMCNLQGHYFCHRSGLCKHLPVDSSVHRPALPACWCPPPRVDLCKCTGFPLTTTGTTKHCEDSQRNEWHAGSPSRWNLTMLQWKLINSDLFHLIPSIRMNVTKHEHFFVACLWSCKHWVWPSVSTHHNIAKLKVPL